MSEMSLLTGVAGDAASAALAAAPMVGADFDDELDVAGADRGDAAALAGKLPPKWAAMAAAKAAFDGMGPFPTMLRKAPRVIWGVVPADERALPAVVEAVELVKGVCAGGRGAPLGPRAGCVCWWTMALMELIKLLTVSLPVCFCPAKAPFAVEGAAAGVGKGRRGTVGGVYAGRPVSKDVDAAPRGAVPAVRA